MTSIDDAFHNLAEISGAFEATTIHCLHHLSAVATPLGSKPTMLAKALGNRFFFTILATFFYSSVLTVKTNVPLQQPEAKKKKKYVTLTTG